MAQIKRKIKPHTRPNSKGKIRITKEQELAFRNKCKAYLLSLKKNEVATMAGAMKYAKTSYSTLQNWREANDKRYSYWQDTIINHIQQEIEKRLITGKGNMVGLIWYSKILLGWRENEIDSQVVKVEITKTKPMNVIQIPTEATKDPQIDKEKE